MDWDCSNSSLREKSALPFAHFDDFVFFLYGGLGSQDELGVAFSGSSVKSCNA